MSTKIYNGVKFEDHNLDELLVRLKGLREGWIDLGCAELDKLVEKVRQEGRSPAETVLTLQQTQYETDAKNLHGIFSWELDFVVYPRHVSLYGQVFCHHPVGRAWLDNQGVYSDYHYQNQTDRPEDVSEFEWEHRSKTWDSIFEDGLVPAQCGWSYQILGKGDIFLHWLGRHRRAQNR